MSLVLKKANTRVNIIKRLPCRPRYTFRTKVKSASNDVVFDYIDLVSKTFCQQSIDLHYCVQNLLVPPPDEQSRILLQYYNIATKINMSGLDLVFIKLIMLNDQESIDTLVKCLSALHHNIDIINNIILYSKNIELMSDNISTQL